MAASRRWTEQELLAALHLYCRLPFSHIHQRNPEIIRFAKLLGRTPGALKMKLFNLAHVDPQEDRKGLSRISAADRIAWQRMEANWGRFARESEAEVQRLLRQERMTGEGVLETELEIPPPPQTPQVTDEDWLDETPLVPSPTEIIKDEEDFWERALGPAERERLTRVRIGQQFFRRTVLSAHDRRCCISGLSLEPLLEASHIIPWSKDRKNHLNPKNGLALSALHHKAFDAGLLTIDEDLRVCVSHRVHPADKGYFYAAALQRYHGQKIIEPRKFKPGQDFLAYHRENVFEKPRELREG